MLQRSVTVAALSGAILFACGCQGKAADEASIQKSLHQKGTAALMDEVAKAPEYHPPADGRITEAQVKLYLDVRQREQQIRAVALKEAQEKGEATPGSTDGGYVEALKTVGDQPGVADIATADLRAAQELGVNPKEYQWVKERVLEAQMAETAHALSQQIAQSRREVLAQLEQRGRETTDPVQKAEIERQVEDLNRNVQTDSIEGDPVRRLNAGLLAKFKEDLARLQAEDQRISQQQHQSRPEGGESPSGGR
ncbi:MAG TPA: hypothetical protein VF173_21170 [Thermoanaerobaculia bacterium]|nr:hypothetical protein [Thermoanaerobaculia bacterium]